MNSKIVWAIIIVLVIYGAYLMMNKTQAPVVEAPVTAEVVATTTEAAVVNLEAAVVEAPSVK